MSLVKSIWSILVGVKDALVLIALLLFFAALYLVMSGAPLGETRGGSLLVSMDGVLVDQAEQDDPLAVLSGASAPLPQVQVRDVVRAVKLAATDDDIQAVVLDLDSFMGGGQVAVSDVARALGEVRKAKKPILAFATGYVDDGYALAAQASEIWMHPMGGVFLAGPGGSQPYFKGLLDRYGVKVHVYRAGRYKAFVEPYERADQSPEAREAEQAVATALWEDWQAMVGKARPKAQLARYAADPVAALDSAGGSMAKAAQSAGLIDRLGDRTAFGRRVAEIAGGDEDIAPGDFNYSEIAAYLAASPESTRGEPIAVVHVSGDIVDGEAPAGMAGGDTVAEMIRQAVADEGARALVLRVDSPGGSALAAERIRLALEDVRKAEIPVIVSMGNVAASGGYWVATAADRIFAEPSTVTGSIGVFGMIPSFQKTLADFGVTSDGIKTTPLSGEPDVLGGVGETADQLFQAGVDDIYNTFRGLVASSRKLTPERAEEIAQGRVWAGGDARQLGLVDAFGSLDDAVAEAAKRAGLANGDYHVLHVEPIPDFFTSLMAAPAVHMAQIRLPADMPGRLAMLRQAELGARLREAAALASGPGVQVRCLACPVRVPVLPRGSSHWFSRMFD